MAGSEYYDTEIYPEYVLDTAMIQVREKQMRSIGLDPDSTADVELYLNMKSTVDEHNSRKLNKSLDVNVKSVMDKYESRARVGFNKYGTDTTRMDLSTLDWLTHLQEELMDATIYVERLKRDIQEL
jgi:hypothetical protein